MKVTTVGIDLAKNVFQAHGVDEHGKGYCQLAEQKMQEQFFGGVYAKSITILCIVKTMGATCLAPC